MDRLDRGTFGHLLRVPHVVLAFFLLVGLIQSTRSQLQALPTELPSLLLFPNIRAQKGQTLGAELYDALVAADHLLPRTSTTLLVTAGVDPRHDEYVTF